MKPSGTRCPYDAICLSPRPLKPSVVWSSVPGLGLWMGLIEAVLVVVHHAGEGLAAEAFVQRRDLAQGGRHVAVDAPACPAPRPAPRAAPSRRPRRPTGERASHWRGSLTSTVCSTWSWLRIELAESPVTLFTRNWKTFWYWRNVKVRLREARLQHAQVGGQGPRVDAVDGQGAFEALDDRRTCDAASRASRRARCPRRPGRRAAGRPGSRPGTTDPGRRTWARCSCRRSRGCRPRCDASGRCSRWRPTAAGERMMAFSSSSTLRPASSRRSRRAGLGPACQACSARSNRRRTLSLEPQMPADGAADVVGRQRVLLGEQLVDAHHERHAGAGRRRGRRR